jgi:1-acyl-sn-glycerol-3-phosphate acyltransferase
VLFVRSFLFNIVFYVNLIAFLVFGCVFYVTPRSWSIAALKVWARASLWWLKVIAGTKIEVRGREHLPAGRAALVAGKHQSLWETFALLPLLDDPAVVLKRELTWIPLFGWFALKFRMLAVDREAGSTALKRLIAQGRDAVAARRQILIFPEGTRRAPDAPPDYKPGAAALYLQLGVPCVPFALNSGLYWPRRKFLRHPGTIIVEFLPPIPPGLKRKDYSAQLQEAIETATARLVAEGRMQQR